MTYDIAQEYQNISNYSPFAHLNEVSESYRFKPFHLPFIRQQGEEKPVHPDTFEDLKLNAEEIVEARLVYPTSSFRTVFDASHNLCYKLPLERRITRLIRHLSDHTMRVSERAATLLRQAPCEKFFFLPEICHYAKDPRFNYIERPMPDGDVAPWFSVIKKQEHTAAFMLKALKNMIEVWLFYAARDLFLEFHTQNVLVDGQGRIYYRDLSDVVGWDDELRRPPWTADGFGRSDVMACTFDRAFCKQNLEHAFRDSRVLGNAERGQLKRFMQEKISQYELEFPAYSVDFTPNVPDHIPMRCPLVWWRDR